MNRSRRAIVSLGVVVSLLGLLLVAAPAVTATVRVSRAEVNSGRLRIEGTAAARRSITVDGVVMGTADSRGAFRIERSNYLPPADCTVDVNDGSATPTTSRLAGCTVTTAPAPTSTPTLTPTPTPTLPPTTPSATPTTALPTATPTGLRIVDETLPDGNVGADYGAFIMACCGNSNGEPYRWKLVDGRVPDGLSFAGDSLRLTRSTGVIGRPTTVQTTTFTVQVTDDSGATARKTFSITINPALPLVITNQSDTLAPGQVGVAYAIGVFAGGGVPPYRWSLDAGQLPPGLSLTTSPGRISGTPTAPGMFTFTLRVSDAAGQQAMREFSITIAP